MISPSIAILDDDLDAVALARGGLGPARKWYATRDQVRDSQAWSALASASARRGSDSLRQSTASACHNVVTIIGTEAPILR